MAESAGGGGTQMFGLDPLTLGLGAANIGLKAFTAFRADETRRQVGQAQMAAARDRLAKEIAMSRDSAKFGEGSKIGGRVASYGFGADLNLGRQKDYDRFGRTELADLDFANQLRGAQANRGFELSGQTQEVREKELNRQMRKSLADKLAQGRGMYGPIGPVDVGSMVI